MALGDRLFVDSSVLDTAAGGYKDGHCWVKRRLWRFIGLDAGSADSRRAGIQEAFGGGSWAALGKGSHHGDDKARDTVFEVVVHHSRQKTKLFSAILGRRQPFVS